MALSLDHLKALDRPALILAWEASFGTPPPRSTSQDMMRLIVGWEIQAKRARANVRALKSAIGKGVSSGSRKSGGATPARLIKPKVTLSPGTRLSREWQGRSYSVDVLDKGYAYDGRLFTSLSPIAKPFERGALYTILKNQTYLGLTTHKGEIFDGEHVPIIDKALYNKVQRILASNRQRDKHKSGAKNPSLLAGKITAASGVTLTPSHAQSKGRRYRYYVERRTDGDVALNSRPIRLPAAEIERSVQSALIAFLQDPIRLMDGLQLSTAARETQDAVRSKAMDIADGMKLAALTSNSTKSIRELIKRIELSTDADGYKLTVNADVLIRLLELPEERDLTDPLIEVSLKLQTCNNGKKVIIGNTAVINPAPIPALINALKLAHTIKEAYLSQSPRSLSEIASSLHINKRQVWRTLKLAFLAPDIQLAILSGTQPRGLCVQDVLDAQIPASWNEQRTLLGFV